MIHMCYEYIFNMYRIKLMIKMEEIQDTRHLKKGMVSIDIGT